MIEVMKVAALATVQDLGRFGCYRDGVGRAGAMDSMALSAGNALLGNDRNAAGIEITMLPFRARFTTELEIAVTGADCGARLDDLVLPPDWAIRASEGQVLSLDIPREGCRAYLCVAGGIDVPEVLGSRSTQLRESFGGFHGRMLKSGDLLKAVGGNAGLPPGGLGVVSSGIALRAGDAGTIAIRVLPAAEYGSFSSSSRAQFWQSDWKISAQSNRTGYRLTGPDLQLDEPLEMRSHGVVPGVIQVPTGGQPIIQLADAATMGGYPKFGTVIEADLWRMAQAQSGDTVRFIETDYAAAVAALDAGEAYLAEVCAMAARQRGAATGWTQ